MFLPTLGDAELLDLILQMLFSKKSYQFLVSKPKTNYRVPWPLGMMSTL